jgi:hypothetical protein
LRGGSAWRLPSSSSSAPPHPINYLTRVFGSRLKVAPRSLKTRMVGFHCLYHTVRSSALSPFVIEGDGQAIIPAPLSPTNNDNQKSPSKTTLNDRRRIFKQIIVKCVLQLLLIETTNDLLRNDEVYRTIPPEHLLRLMGVLDHSYQFARMFNEDKELRTGLWKVGECIESSETISTRLKATP